MDKEIIVPQKGSKAYNGLLNIFEDEDVLDIALKEAVDVLSHIDYEFDFLNYYNVSYRYNELTGGYSRSPDSRSMLDEYISSEDDLDFLIWFLLKTMPNREEREKEWAVKILRNRISDTKYGNGRAQEYFKMLTSEPEGEKGDVQPAEVKGKQKREAGRPRATLFKDEAVKNRECERVKEYLKKSFLQGSNWTSGKDDARTKVALCFAKCWKEQGIIDEDYSAKALVDFMIDSCRLMTEVDRKTLANKINERKGEECDPEMLKLVGAQFKNN